MTRQAVIIENLSTKAIADSIVKGFNDLGYETMLFRDMDSAYKHMGFDGKTGKFNDPPAILVVNSGIKSTYHFEAAEAIGNLGVIDDIMNNKNVALMISTVSPEQVKKKITEMGYSNVTVFDKYLLRERDTTYSPEKFAVLVDQAMELKPIEKKEKPGFIENALNKLHLSKLWAKG